MVGHVLWQHPDDLKYFDEFFLTEKKQTEAFLGFKRYYQGISGYYDHFNRRVAENIKHFREYKHGVRVSVLHLDPEIALLVKAAGLAGEITNYSWCVNYAQTTHHSY